MCKNCEGLTVNKYCERLTARSNVLFQIIGPEESAWIGIIPSKNMSTWSWVDGSYFDVPQRGCLHLRMHEYTFREATVSK